MEGPPCLSIAADQTAGPPAVFRIVLKNLALLQSFQHIVEEDVLLGHLLLGMLSHSELLTSCLLGDSPLDESEVVRSQSTSLSLILRRAIVYPFS
jgi:hypothetical protein